MQPIQAANGIASVGWAITAITKSILAAASTGAATAGVFL